MKISKKWRYGILIALFLVAFVQYQYRSPKRHYSDFHVPYMTGKFLLSGQPIYSYDNGVSYYKYTPFYATLISPLSLLPEREAASIWFLFNILLICSVFIYSRKLIVKDKDFDPFWLYVLTSIVMSRVVLANFHQGQANIFMFALAVMGLHCYQQKQYIKSAFLLGFSIMSKYMTVLLVPYFLLHGAFLPVVGIFGMIGFLYVLPAAAFGMARNIELIRHQMHFLFASSLDPWSIYCQPNQSLLGMISRFFWKKSEYGINIMHLDKSGMYAIFIAAAGVLFLLSVLPFGKSRNTDGEEDRRWLTVIEWGMLFICVFLFNPNGWKYFSVFLVFPYMLVIHHLMKTRFRDTVILILFLLSFALYALTSEFLVSWWFNDDIFEIWSSFTWAALLLFTSLVILKIRCYRRRT